MTLERANQITDAVSSILISPRNIDGTQFTPLSLTGAKNRIELVHALHIVTAQVYQSFLLQGNADSADSEFVTFSNAASSSLIRLLYLSPCIPDHELEKISGLSKFDPEFLNEQTRLMKIIRNSELDKIESTQSFLTFLRTLEITRGDYWLRVYQRLDLPCPDELLFLTSPLRKKSKLEHAIQAKPWWRFW